MPARLATPGGRRPRAPLGLMGASALVLLVEVLIAANPLTMLSGFQWENRRARETAASGAINDCSILAFGDSMLKLGLVPAALEGATGRRAYNFAVTAAQAPAAYALLKRSIDAGARPDAVLIECFPNLLALGPAHNLDQYPALLDPDEVYDLTAGRGDWGLLGPMLARWAIPSVRSTQTIRRLLVEAFAAAPNLHREGTLVGLRNWAANRGYQNNAAAGPPQDLLFWQHGYFRFRAVHPTNRRYLERFLALAERHEIAVFWLLPPYQPALQAACEQSGFDAFHESFVRDLAARHPKLRVIDGRHAHYDPAAFMDPHHLINPGAQVFSAEVGGVLRRYFERPGAFASSWIDLPRYQPRAVAARVESLDESRAEVVRAGLIR